MEIIDSIYTRIEAIFDGFGLMTGEFAPLKRAAIGVLFFGVIFSWIKPRIFYNANGTMKKFGSGEGETYFTMWMACLLLGGAGFGLFI